MRSQVQNYVKIPKRLVVTADISPENAENQLTEMVNIYLEKSEKTAFPKMEKWELSLMMNKELSSSPWAISKFCDTAFQRSGEIELKEISEFSGGILPENTDKGKQLLSAVKLAFSELKRLGANRKIIIFSEYKLTIKFLNVLLKDYKTVTFDGNYSAIEKFRNEAEILITTDIASEGFNLEFCSFIVNFDLPYNTQTLEQRIMRCHRQGQENDVIVLNFLNKNNIADVRILELINKRVAQFDGIVGGSDDVSGNFSENAINGLTKIFKIAKHKNEIEREFKENLNQNADKISKKITAAENALFTTFTPEIAEKITITPQIILDKTTEINAELWELVKYFFEGKQGYFLDEKTQTLRISITAQKVFTGASLRKREYSVSDRSISLTSAIVKNIIKEIFWVGVPENGNISVSGLDFFAEICYNKVVVKVKNSFFGVTYYVFCGLSENRILTDENCKKIMDLPVINFTTNGRSYGERDGNLTPKKPHKLDNFLDTKEILRHYTLKNNFAIRDEISRLKTYSRRQKNALLREIELLKREIKKYEIQPENVAERVKNEKKKAVAIKELKKREQSIFLESMKIDAETERKIADLTAEIDVSVQRIFAIKITGEPNG